MKKNLIAINLLLFGVAIFLGYQLKTQWASYQAKHNLSLLNPKVDRNSHSPELDAKSPDVRNYAAVVDSHLFTPDRNNVIPLDPAPAPNNLGPKPILTGILALGEKPFALMFAADSKEGRNYKRLRVGESLNGYTLVKILDQKVLMSAEGQEVEVPLSEPSKLVARDLPGAIPSTSEPASGTLPSNNAARVTSVGSAPISQSFDSKTNQNVAVPTGVIPPGTIRDGKKKILVPSPFGPMEAWVDVKESK